VDGIIVPQYINPINAQYNFRRDIARAFVFLQHQLWEKTGESRAMNKFTAIVAVSALILLASLVFAPARAAQPPIQRPMGFVAETVEGSSPSTVDYSIAYDTASGELIQNMMDTLVIFNAERTDQYLPSVASNWTGPNGGLGGYFSAIDLTQVYGWPVDSGIPISGLTFENPASQTGPNATYYYRYDFKIRQGIFFQPPWNYSLTGDDMVFSFQRTMIMDTASGPQWMIQEPLLDVGGDTLDVSGGGCADLTNMTQVAEVGALIQNAVQSNGTDVWFNLMFPGAYAPFMQILTQTWSSIESKQWINSQVIGAAGRTTEWDGNWPDYTTWLNYHNPNDLDWPLDTQLSMPTALMYGSGPYIITTLEYVDPGAHWSGVRNVNYWRGWPADFPASGSAAPAGWTDSIYVTSVNTWPSRLADFENGAADFVEVPRQNLADVFKNSTRPYSGSNYPLDGLRDIQPLPMAWVEAYFFTFNIDPATIYGPIGPADTFGNSLIPSDFFGNANWGIKVRQAFAQAFDYNSWLANLWLGEASHPATAIVPGLNYYDPSVTGYSYSLAAANASFNLVGPDSNGKILKDVGFTITLLANTGSLTREQSCLMLKSAIESLNPLYHVNAVFIPWSSYLHAAVVQKVPLFMMGWLADFPDPSDLALPFYRTGGTYAAWQAYSNPTMDALVDAGIRAPDGPARAQIYHNIQALAVQDCPSFTLDQAIGRHFERDWVVGWYYNPAYPGLYFYNLWKWYYQAESQLSVAQNPPAVTPALAGFNLPVDVNYDGKVDMKDIGIVARAFCTSFGPPQDARWIYRGDINNDRKIDLKDVGLVARQFGESSAAWPLVKSTITPSSPTVAQGTPVTFTETVFGAPTTIDSVLWGVSQWPGPVTQVQIGSSLTFTYTFPAAGTYYVLNNIAYTVNSPYGNLTTSICEIATVIVT
jgi:peptide/nickel transport system substrate-binding protein